MALPKVFSEANLTLTCVATLLSSVNAEVMHIAMEAVLLSMAKVQSMDNCGLTLSFTRIQGFEFLQGSFTLDAFFCDCTLQEELCICTAMGGSTLLKQSANSST